MKLDMAFLEAASALTDAEVKALPPGAFTMTLECGSRFLKDYLDGGKYFRTPTPNTTWSVPVPRWPCVLTC